MTDLKIWTTKIFAVVALVLFATQPTFAADQPNILIMSEDSDADTVPRGSRIFNRVQRAIENEMQVEGFTVFDETAVSMDITSPSKSGRTDAELLTIARRIQSAPIDVVIVFQIFANSEKNAYADISDLRIRVSGRMIDVRNGRALGNYEVSYGPNQLPPLPPNCDRNCVLENVGNESKRIARDVADVLATKLDYLSPATTAASSSSNIDQNVNSTNATCTGLSAPYSLTLIGFETEELNEIESVIIAFSGYSHHRPVRITGTEASYWYETCADSAKLVQNLRAMISMMDTEARVSLIDNKIEIDHIRKPKSR